MKKIKSIGSLIFVVLLLVPFIRISVAQGSYVGVKNGDEYEWALSVYPENWNTYIADDLGVSLENLVPLGASNLTRVFNDWKNFAPPQSYWSLKVNSVDIEETGLLFSPGDNTTITYTPINGNFGWLLSLFDSDEWDETLYIVNDTSSFLRQTVNLSSSFSFYSMFSVFIAPTTISWSSLVSEFLAEMTAKGGLYTNITAAAQSNGYLIDIPALGFENNTAAININVKYNSKGILSYFKFSYGGQTLLDFKPGKFIPEHERVPEEYYFLFIGLMIVLLAEIVFYIFIGKGRK